MKQIPPSVQTSLLTVLFTFFFLYIFARLFGPIPFSVNSITTVKQDMFSVSGEGEATAVPNTALLNLGVTENANTVEQAKNKVTEKTNNIIAGLKNLGVEEKNIKTTNYSIYPNYDYSGRNDRISGYSVSQNLEVKINPIEKANQAVDLATEKGANMIGNIQFTLEDDVREKLEQQARETAIKKAKTKAQSIANASGINLGRLINVSEYSNDNRPPVMFEKSALDQNGNNAQPTELQPGENTVHVNVTLSYETF